MAMTIHSGDEVFLDTSYALALSAPTDEFHGEALVLAAEIEAASARLVTTRAVLMEIGNALARLRYRPAAIKLLQSLEADPSVELVTVSDESASIPDRDATRKSRRRALMRHNRKHLGAPKATGTFFGVRESAE